MGMRRFGSVVAFVTLLLCALTVGRTELSNDEAASGSASPEMDQVTAKWLWINCNVDLMDMKRTVEGLDSCHSEDMPIYTVANDIEKQYLVRSKLGEVLSVLPPHLKQTLLGCLRKHNIVFHVSRKGGGYNGWYTEYLEYLFRWPDASRRYLSDVFTGIAVNPSSSSAPSPSPGILPPTYGPTPSADPPAPHFAAPSPRRLAEVPQSSFSSAKPPDVERVGSGQRNLTPAPSPAKRNSSRTVVIAVVVTAGATIFVAVLLFCCYRKCRKNSSSTDGPKDESPLLSISFSDFSGGSSGHLGKSTSKERFGTIPFSTPSRNGRPSSLVTNISTESNVEKPSVTGAALISDPSTDSPALPDNTSSPVPHPPGKTAPPPPRPPPPPMPSGIKPGPRPPPPPMGNAPPRPPPFALKSKTPQPSPLGPNHSGSTGSASAESEAPKTKLKPFFWDKVLANPDQSMVWHQIKSGSFQFNEETIETLFGYNNVDKNKAQRAKDVLSQDPSTQYIQIIDSKKAQNLSILLRALNLTTEEVCDALYEGNELPLELCQTLLKMAPTSDEELKLRLYNGKLTQLGPAERFLKVLINIPFAFKRMDSLSFMISYHEEVTILKESLATLEVACKELRSSRLFLKLLEAVLKTGNRMNNGTFRGGAQAFKLDTLLKLADVKGADGKTTLLHFVVQEIVRSEGVRAARADRKNQSLSSVKSDDLSEDSLNETEEHYSNLGLQVVSCLGVELENVKKASVLDADALSGTVTKLDHALAKSREFLNTEMKSLEEDSSFHHTLQSFVQNAEVDITWLIEEEKRVVALVKKTADYFHGNAKTDEGLRLFVIVRNFLIMLDKTCKEVKESITRSTRMSRHPAVPPSSDGTQRPFPAAESPEKTPSQDIHQLLFPAIKDRRMDHSSSDDEDS